MTYVYFVMRDGCGAHEPEGVMSVWDDQQKAQIEVDRLSELGREWVRKSMPSYEVDDYRQKYFILAAPLNLPSEESLT